MSVAAVHAERERLSVSDIVIAGAFLIPLVLAPLPQASVPSSARALLTCLVCVAGLFFGASILRGSSPFRLPVAFIPLALFVGLGFAQLLPVAPLLTTSAEQMLGDVRPASLSLIPARTAPRARECLTLLLLYCAGASLLSRRIKAAGFASTLLCVGAGLSIYGILVRGGALPTLVADQTREVVVATFFNRNNLAGFLELCVLSALGLWLACCSRRNAESKRPVQILVGAGGVLCVVTLLLTESRAGVVSLLAGIGTLVVLCRRIRGHRIPLVPTILLASGLAGALCWAWPETLSSRFAGLGEELAAEGTRPDIWVSGARLAAAFPLSGTGLGTYRDVSPLTQSEGIGGRIEHAHNDILEFLVETGVPGLLLLLAAGFCFARFVWSRIASVEDPTRAHLAAGGASGLLALTVHGLVDFNFQIPANAVWAAVTAGCVVGLLSSRRTAVLTRSSRAWTVAAGLLLLVSAVGSGREVLSAYLEDSSYDQASIDGRIGRLQLAEGIHPRCGEAAASAGWALIESQDARARSREVISFARSALVRNPFNPEFHRLLARGQLLTDGQNPRRAFETALRFTNPDDRPQHDLNVAFAYMATGRLDAGLAWIRDLLIRRESMGGEPDYGTVFRALYDRYPIYDVVRSAVPLDSPQAHEALAALLLQKGEFYGRELELAAASQEPADPSRITMAPGIQLIHWQLEDGFEKGRRVVRVDLAFAVEDGVDELPDLNVHCIGGGAQLYRWFRVSDGPFSYSFHLDPTLPPGPYTFGIDFPRREASMPLGTVVVEESPLELRIDEVHTASESLYWSTGNPGKRSRRSGGIPLRPRDLLWRNVRLEEGDFALVVVCSSPASLRVTLDGHPLPGLSHESALAKRFAVVGDGGARLLELEAGDQRLPVVEKLFLLPRSVR